MAIPVGDFPEYERLFKELRNAKTNVSFYEQVIKALKDKQIIVDRNKIRNVMTGAQKDWAILIAVREHFQLIGRPVSEKTDTKPVRKSVFAAKDLGLKKPVLQ